MQPAVLALDGSSLAMMVSRPVELAITICYFAVIVIIALAFRRRAGKGEVAYLGAGRQIGFLVNGFAQFSGLVSAASFLGFLGLAYKLGWSYTTMAFGVGSTLGFILCMLLASGPLRRYSEMKGKFTLSGFFADRYGSSTSLATSVFILILFPLYIVVQLIGGGLAGQYVLGIPFHYAVILMAVVYVGYVMLGGMLSASWIDFMQGILMYSFMVGLSITAIIHFGGVGSLVSQAVKTNPYFLSLHPGVSPWTYFGISLGVLVFALSSPHVIMRLFIARNVRQGRAALSLTAGLSLTFHLVGYLGVAGAALIVAPKLTGKQIDNTYLETMSALFPLALRGLAVAGILAAIMSTTDVMLLAAGAEFSQNIYRRFIHPQADDRRTILVARLTVLVIGVITALLALQQTQSIGTIASTLLEGTGSAFCVPLLAGIWWRRANKAGGLASCVGGFVVFAAIYGLKLVPADALPALGALTEPALWLVQKAKTVPAFAEILVSLPASMVFMVVFSLLTAPPSAEQVRFVDTLHRDSSGQTPVPPMPQRQATVEPAGVRS